MAYTLGEKILMQSEKDKGLEITPSQQSSPDKYDPDG